jgi:hypothetical protein
MSIVAENLLHGFGFTKVNESSIEFLRNEIGELDFSDIDQLAYRLRYYFPLKSEESLKGSIGNYLHDTGVYTDKVYPGIKRYDVFASSLKKFDNINSQVPIILHRLARYGSTAESTLKGAFSLGSNRELREVYLNLAFIMTQYDIAVLAENSTKYKNVGLFLYHIFDYFQEVSDDKVILHHYLYKLLSQFDVLPVEALVHAFKITYLRSLEKPLSEEKENHLRDLILSAFHNCSETGASRLW